MFEVTGVSKTFGDMGAVRQPDSSSIPTKNGLTKYTHKYIFLLCLSP